jgi:hypothetical protein
MNEKLLAECTSQILEELDKACTKYPGFCPIFLRKSATLLSIRDRLNCLRVASDDEGKALEWSVQTTLDEEVSEAYEAYAEKDYKHCLEELAQVGCVVIRAMAWIREHHKEKHNG